MPSKTPVVFVALMLPALLCFYAPGIFAGHDFYYRDNTLFFEPLCRYIGLRLASGQVPLWNEYCYCGMSELANPSPGIFYPPNWLFALLDFSRGLSIQMILHQLLLGIGSYLLIRSFGMSTLSATVGGLIMSLNGWSFSLESNYSIVASASWIPLVLYALRTIEHSPGLLRAASASAMIALMIYAGRPEMVAPGIVLAGLVPATSLIRKWLSACEASQAQADEDPSGDKPRSEEPNARDGSSEQGRQLVRTAFLQASVLLCGILLAAPQIVPTLEWLQLSRRAQGLSTEEVLLFSANWYDLLGFLAAQPLGDLTLRGNQFLGLVSDGRMAPYIPSALVGATALSLAAVGLAGSQSRRRWYLPGGLVLTMLWCLGSTTPVAEVMLQLLPALSFFRFPSKFLIFPIAFIAALAVLGTETIQHQRKPAARPLFIIWSAVAIAGVFLMLVPGAGPFSTLSNDQIKQAAPAILAQADALVGNAILAAAGVGVLTAALLWAWEKGKISAVPFNLLLSLMLTASLAAPAVAFQQHTSPKFFDSSVGFLAQEMGFTKAAYPDPGDDQKQLRDNTRVLNLALESFTCPPSRQQKTPAENTAAWYQYARQMMNPNTNIDENFQSAYGYEASMCGDYVDTFIRCYDQSSQTRNVNSPMNDAAIHRFCKATATKFVITQTYRLVRRGQPAEEVRLLDDKLFALKKESPEDNFRIYAVRNAKPRIQFVTNWSYSADRAGPYLEDGTTAEFPFVDQKLPVMPLVSAAASPARIKADFVHPEKLELEVTCSADGLLIVSDQHYPGWKAAVDAQPVPIIRANGYFRAIALKAGKHRVTMKYEPDSFKLGLAIAASALVYLLVVWAWYRRGRRSRNDS